MYEVCWDDRGLAFTDFGKAGSLRKSKLPSKFNIRSGFDVALWRPSTCFNFGTLALNFDALWAPLAFGLAVAVFFAFFREVAA